MKLTRQCFIVSREFAAAFSEEEVTATYADMLEMDIARPPYQDFDVMFPADIFFRPSDNTWQDLYITREEAIESMKQWKIKLRYTDGIGQDWFCDRKNGSWWSLDEIKDEYFRGQKELALDRIKTFIIVALATRNVVKDMKANKAAKLGIGKAAREGYAVTTTLKIGDITESISEGDGHHASPRPHLRRGHIRRQHYGPNHELIKKVWIQPTFVNADETFIEKRTAYNMSPTGAKQ